MDQTLQSIRKNFRPFRTLLVEYCDHSNIHGVRYLSEKLLHWSERLWWIIALVASLGLCGYAAVNIWIGWRDNPVTFSYSEPSIPISEIPFPTITICPEIKSDSHEFDLIAALKHLSNLTEYERIVLNSMAHICPNLRKTIELSDDFVNKDIYRLLRMIAPSYEETLFNLKNNNNEPVATVFTEEGLCFAYNALNSQDIYTDDISPEMMNIKVNKNALEWSLEKDILNKSAAAERFPIHETHSMPTAAFNTNLRIFERNLNYQCRMSEDEIKVIFSAPGDALKFSGNYYRLALEQIAFIVIKPTLTIASDGLRKYDPQQRQCFFDSERRLRFFKIYSQSNCEAECLTNFTYNHCGCVKFSQPRDRSTRVCGSAKINCYKRAENFLSAADSNTKLFNDKCNCLPACFSIEYETNVERSLINMENIKEMLRSVNYKLPASRYAYLQTYFKDEHVKVIKRIESYTLTDFLAYCGGLLGVFMGVSALSIIEIIYYATLRLYFIIRPMGVSNAVIPFHQEGTNFIDRFRFIRGIRAFVVEFCDNSNIHGFIYFTRRGLHWIERLWWIISFGISLWLCSTMIIDVWRGWQENPVKITFTHNERPVSDIPFPTITICPPVKYMRHKLDLTPFLSIPFDYIKIIKRINKSLRDNKNYRSTLHICRFLQSRSTLDQLQSYPLTADEDIRDIIQDIGPQFDDVFHKCIWQGEVVDCSKYVTPLMTARGLCFAFNALKPHKIYSDEMAIRMEFVKGNTNITNWSMEKGYENEKNQNDYPLRVYDSGRGSAVEISLNMFEKDFDLFCNSFEQGILVNLFAPDSALIHKVNNFIVPFMEETVITMKPKLTTTSDGLRKYDPNHRKCFFETERKLRFYKTYTKDNCEVECLANFTKESCGCVTFSQPRDVDTPVCGVANIACYNFAEHRLSSHLASDMDVEQKFLESCNCLPSCTTIEYNVEYDHVRFDQSAIAVTAGRNVNVSGIHRAKLVIYFEDKLIDTEKREELYTIEDLFTLCGGLLGLFMGISVLSLAEILYYSSLRWYWILRRATSETN